MMNKQPFKRTLSLILSIAMICSITGLSTVFAAGGDGADSDSNRLRSVPVNVSTFAELAAELLNSSDSTINVTGDITLEEGITLGTRTLIIANGVTFSTGDYPITISQGDTLTLGGPGTLEAANSEDDSDSVGVMVYGALELTGGIKLVTANSGNQSVGVRIEPSGTLTGDSTTAITTANTGTNSNGIQAELGSSMTLTGGTLRVKNEGDSHYGVEADTLTTDGTTISIESAGDNGIVSQQASITGGTVSVTNSGGNGLNVTDLKLTNTTVTVQNTRGKGIHVPMQGSIALTGSTIALQNTALTDPDNQAGLYFNDETTLTMDATSAITVATSGGNVNNTGLRGLSLATLDITAGAKITLVQGARLNAVEDCFEDQGVQCANTGSFTVDAQGADVSSDGLTAGDYVWDADKDLFTKAGTNYLTVMGIPVTDANKNLVTGPGITNGAVRYDPATKTLTLENATLTGTISAAAIDATEDLTINLIGENRIGIAPNDPADRGDYLINQGISSDKSISLTGTGSLTIYDGSTGIEAKENLTVNIGGSLTVVEYGSGLACCLKAGGAVTIKRGTLNLSSRVSNGIKGGSIVINGAAITIQTNAAVNPETGPLYAFDPAPTFGAGYTHKVFAGDSAATALEVASPTAATFTQAKYVRILSQNTGSDILINAQNFPDANFRAWLLDGSNIGGAGADGVLTPAEIAGITEINVLLQSIADLTGIEHFTALTELYCSNNRLTTLDVSALTELTTLNCGGNQLTSLGTLPASLTKLNCLNNRLTALNVSGLTALKELDCGGNRLTSLGTLPTGLTKLNCGINRLTTLDVSALTKLTTLDCGYNQLTTLDVSALTSLTYLACGGNQLTTLGSLPTSLTYLGCYQNRLTGLDVTGLTGLNALQCQYNYMASESAVTGFNGSWDGGNIFAPQHAPGYVAVNSIIDLTTDATVGVPLTLTGTVVPADATNKTIVWSFHSNDDGSTQSVLNGNLLTAKKTGEVWVIATITNGQAADKDYNLDFFIYVTAPTYTITFYANGGTVSPTSAATGTDGKLQSLPTPTRSDYRFDGWYTAASGGTAVTTATVFTSNATIYAHWTYTGGGGGSGGSGSGSGSSGGGGGGGKGTGITAKPTTTDKPSANVDSTGSVKPADVTKTATDKIAAAIKAGQKNPQASVPVVNAKSVSAKTLQEMAAAAKKAGGTVRLLADTTAKGKIIARLYLDTTLAGNLKNDILLGVTIDPKETKATADLFLKSFGSKVSVVRMAHQGEFGMRVQVAVKADPAVDFTKPVFFYAYDKATNTYQIIKDPVYTVDKNGWLYFYTSVGGDILYTNQPLS